MKDIATAFGYEFLGWTWTAADVFNLCFYDDHSRKAYEKLSGKVNEHKQRFQYLRSMWKSHSAICKDCDYVQNDYGKAISRLQQPADVPVDDWHAIASKYHGDFCTTGVHFIRVEFGQG